MIHDTKIKVGHHEWVKMPSHNIDPVLAVFDVGFDRTFLFVEDWFIYQRLDETRVGFEISDQDTGLGLDTKTSEINDVVDYDWNDGQVERQIVIDAQIVISEATISTKVHLTKRRLRPVPLVLSEALVQEHTELFANRCFMHGATTYDHLKVRQQMMSW